MNDFFKKISKQVPKHITLFHDKSVSLSITIHYIMEDKNISSDKLSELTGYDIYKINEMLCGSYDFKLSEISKLEEALCSKLLKVKERRIKK